MAYEKSDTTERYTPGELSPELTQATLDHIHGVGAHILPYGTPENRVQRAMSSGSMSRNIQQQKAKAALQFLVDRSEPGMDHIVLIDDVARNLRLQRELVTVAWLGLVGGGQIEQLEDGRYITVEKSYQ